MSAHALFAPSGAARIAQCSASLGMEQRYPETEDDPTAAEGTAAHWVLEQGMQGALPVEGAVAPNGIIVSEEMLEGALLAIERVDADLAFYGLPRSSVAVEVPVTIKRVHEQCWGTPDMRVWVKAPNGRPTLYVWDYKFGRRAVEAFENLQLAAYAAGCIEQAGISDLTCDVVLTIIQPRCYHRDGPVRWWKTAASNLRAILNVYSGACHEALTENAKLRTGEECRDCRAKHACPALQRAAYSAADVAMSGQPLELPPDGLGLELTILTLALQRLEARITGLSEQAEMLSKRGTRVPGWDMQRGRGGRVWTVPDAQAIAIGHALGKDLAKPIKAVTPRQAELAGLDPRLLAGLCKEVPGEMKLTRDDGSLTRRVFGP